MNQQENKTLAIGGSGKTGRRVAARLNDLGVPTAVASRSGEVRFDWEDRATWETALTAVRQIYLTYHPDLAVPSAAPDIRELAALAVARGVRRIVLLSGRGEPQVLPSEAAVRDSGVEYTILRCAWFNQNFSEGALLGPLLGGVLEFPAGNVAEPFLDCDDIADVAVAALTDGRHAGVTYELSGPRLITFGEAVSLIARASGRRLEYVPVSLERYRELLAEHVPAEVASFLAELFGAVLDGHNQYLSEGVQRALGREPRDFERFARTAAAAGAWSV